MKDMEYYTEEWLGGPDDICHCWCHWTYEPCAICTTDYADLCMEDWKSYNYERKW